MERNLTVDDLSEIVNALSPVESKCQALGIQLKVQFNRILSIEGEKKGYNDRLSALIVARLKQDPPLTWRIIVNALRTPSVNESNLAKKIESQMRKQGKESVSSCQSTHTPQTSVEQPPSSQPPTASPEQVPVATSQPSANQPPLTVPRFLPHNGGNPLVQDYPFAPNNVLTLCPPQTPQQLLYTPLGYVNQYQPSLPLPRPTQYSRPALHAYQPPALQPNYPPPQVARLPHTPVLYYQSIQPPNLMPPQPHAYALSYQQTDVPVPQQHHFQSVRLPRSTNTAPLVKQFVDFVKARYMLQGDLKVTEWTQTTSREFINPQYTVPRNSESDSTETMVCDDVTTLPLDMNLLSTGHPGSVSGKRMLVEGDSGVGKSMLASEFCRKWGRGEIAQQYQLVLLLRLVDDTISKAKTLKDLIQHPSEEVRRAITAELESTEGHNSLIILEGFDQLPEASRTPPSVFHNLIVANILPRASVIVTSQPWATVNVCGLSTYDCYKIVGFTKQQISKYMARTMSENEAKKFYIESHPQIQRHMHIPLNIAAVVTVYQGDHDNSPTTLTGLYTSLVKTLVLRHLKSHPEYEKGTENISCFQGLLVPPHVHAKFSTLCKLAYDGIIHVQHIFKNLQLDFDSLGLMDPTTELFETAERTAPAYKFLHQVFQEYLAAVHISNMCALDQMDHFVKYKTDVKMRTVLKFLAGLKKLNCFSEITVPLVRQTPTPVDDDSIYSSSCDVAVDVDLVNWMYEAQSDDVFALFFGRKKVEYLLDSAMSSTDFYSLGYCISHCQCMCFLLLRPKTCISPADAKMLQAGATESGTGLGRVMELARLEETCGINKVPVPAECLNMMCTENKAMFCLHQLSLRLSVPCDNIQWPDVSQLQVLNLVIEEKLSNCWLNTLLPHLPSLQSFSVEYYRTCLQINDHKAIADFAASSINLKELSISNLSSEVVECFSLDNYGVETITEALVKNHLLQLKTLKMAINVFTVTAAKNLAQFISNSTTLQHLTMKGSIVTGSEVMDGTLPINIPQEESDSPYNSISDGEAAIIAEAIHVNFTLKTLDLSNNCISKSGAEALSQTLHQNSALERLDLSNNSISSCGAGFLARALLRNPVLNHLILYNTTIGDAGAVSI